MNFRDLAQSISESLRGGHRDYTAGPISRAIILLAVPMILEMAMESLFAVVDIFWVAHLGYKAVATVGLTESLLTIVFGIAIGVSIAATATVARRIGEKNSEGASHAAAQAILLGATIIVALAILGSSNAHRLLLIMSDSSELAGYGAPFTRIMLGAIPSVMMLFLFNAIFRGAGNAVIAMRALWIGNAINLILDPLFIFGLGPVPAFGVTGAAIATSTGRSAGALYGFWHLTRGSGEIHLHARHWRLDLPLMKQFVAIAFPATVQNLVPMAGWLALVRIVAMFGSGAVAGYTIAVRIVIFSILPAWGLSNAAATLVGQNLGAKQPERAERSVMQCGIYNMVFLAAVGLAFIFFAGPIVSLFTSDPAVGDTAAATLRTFSYGYLFFAWGMVLVQAYNGAGDSRTPTWINFAAFWLCQIPLAWVLARPLGFGTRGAFAAVPISYFVFVAAAWLVFRKGRWKTVNV